MVLRGKENQCFHVYLRRSADASIFKVSSIMQCKSIFLNHILHSCFIEMTFLLSTLMSRYE